MFKSITNSIQKVKSPLSSASTQFRNGGGLPRVRHPVRGGRSSARAGACFLAGVSAYFASAQCHYTYTVIPNPSGWVCYGRAINDLGHVAGNLQNIGDARRGFIWTPEAGTMVLPTPQGVTNLEVNDINDLGHVCGSMNGPDGMAAFVWDGQDYTTILPPAWANGIEATSLNDQGQLVGRVFNNIIGPTHAFICQDGIFVDLGPDISPSNSIATAISETQHVAGHAGGSGVADRRSFVWHEEVSWLEHPAELDHNQAQAISNNGFLAGFGNTELPVQYFGLVWTSWSTSVIAPPPEFRDARLFAVNDAGRAVGYYDRRVGGGALPIAWQNGQAADLTALVDPSALPWLRWAKGINRVGQIVANDNGTLVLTPVWLPGDLTGDCEVGIDDLALVLSNFGAPIGSFPMGDVDADGEVDLADLAILLGHWGE